ncbi:MAG: Type 1 glutamine amidotransferase-like domain-containing protein [Candidatus Saccharimonadales bacterium]
MNKISVFSDAAEMLLTSAGPTSPASQERMQAMARPNGQPSRPRIVRLADGWTPLSADGGTNLRQTINQKLEAMAGKFWSHHYLRYLLGESAVIDTVFAGRESRQAFRTIINDCDLLIAPGGNTYQIMAGLAEHADTIKQYLAQGKPYVGASAGTIITGIDLSPASLKPADAYPQAFDPSAPGLNIITANIVTHAAGRQGRQLAMPGLTPTIASFILKHYETPLQIIEQYRTHQTAPIITLNDRQSLAVSGGEISWL